MPPTPHKQSPLYKLPPPDTSKPPPPPPNPRAHPLRTTHPTPKQNTAHVPTPLIPTSTPPLPPPPPYNHLSHSQPQHTAASRQIAGQVVTTQPMSPRHYPNLPIDQTNKLGGFSAQLSGTDRDLSQSQRFTRRTARASQST